MVSRITRLIVFLLVLAVVLYIVLLNREPITVHLGGDATYQAMGGVVLIVVFALGLLSASLVGVIFGVRTYFRERNFQSKEKQRKALFDGLLLARSYAASNEWEKARYEYEQLVKRHPGDIISRVEYSRVIEGQGDPREALRILDTARSENPNNIEVLLRAAELNIALKNRTAAIDNLALVLLHQPSVRAATMARDLSEELERYDDALEYQERLDAIGDDQEEGDKIRARIRFKKLLKEQESNPAGLKDAVAAFVKKEPCACAIEKLGDLELAAGNREQAAQLYARVARESASAEAIRKSVKIWLDLNQPQQALAAARAAIKDTTGRGRVNAELELVRTYIAVNMLEEAKSALAKLPSVAHDAEVEFTPEIAKESFLLQAQTFVKLGDTTRANTALKALSEGSLTVEYGNAEHFNGRLTDAPAPRLSTP